MQAIKACCTHIIKYTCYINTYELLSDQAKLRLLLSDNRMDHSCGKVNVHMYSQKKHNDSDLSGYLKFTSANVLINIWTAFQLGGHCPTGPTTNQATVANSLTLTFVCLYMYCIYMCMYVYVNGTAETQQQQQQQCSTTQ